MFDIAAPSPMKNLSVSKIEKILLCPKNFELQYIHKIPEPMQDLRHAPDLGRWPVLHVDHDRNILTAMGRRDIVEERAERELFRNAQNRILGLRETREDRAASFGLAAQKPEIVRMRTG